jgi:hypothetical protein
MNRTANQEETAVRMLVRELRDHNGHMPNVGKAALKFARRLLRLNYKCGLNADKDFTPFLEAAGFDPAQLRVTDYDKWETAKEAFREKQTSLRLLTIRNRSETAPRLVLRAIARSCLSVTYYKA